MAQANFEKLRVYRLSENLADEIWNVAVGWECFARDTIGRQIVRAADSIGANIAEGVGRGSFQDNRRFVRTARPVKYPGLFHGASGSLNETQHFLRRAFRRKRLTHAQVKKLKPLVDELGPRLNAYLKSIGPRPNEPATTLPTTDHRPRTTNH